MYILKLPFVTVGEPPKKVDAGKVISVPVVHITTNQEYKPSPQGNNAKVVARNPPEVAKPAQILNANAYVVDKGSADKEYHPSPQAKNVQVIANKPPEAFKLAQVQEKDVAVKPCPSSSRPFKDVNVFQQVDARALEVVTSHVSYVSAKCVLMYLYRDKW